jgi:hypothetical protein
MLTIKLNMLLEACGKLRLQCLGYSDGMVCNDHKIYGQNDRYHGQDDST